MRLDELRRNACSDGQIALKTLSAQSLTLVIERAVAWEVRHSDNRGPHLRGAPRHGDGGPGGRPSAHRREAPWSAIRHKGRLHQWQEPARICPPGQAAELPGPCGFLHKSPQLAELRLSHALQHNSYQIVTIAPRAAHSPLPPGFHHALPPNQPPSRPEHATCSARSRRSTWRFRQTQPSVSPLPPHG